MISAATEKRADDLLPPNIGFYPKVCLHGHLLAENLSFNRVCVKSLLPIPQPSSVLFPLRPEVSYKVLCHQLSPIPKAHHGETFWDREPRQSYVTILRTRA